MQTWRLFRAEVGYTVAGHTRGEDVALNWEQQMSMQYRTITINM